MKKSLWVFLILGLCQALPAAAEAELSRGQLLYLPVYSQIWHGDLGTHDNNPRNRLVSALISIRNTSLLKPIRVISARYYSTNGKLLKEYIASPVEISAMSTLELFVERRESAGGSGANFVIEWDSVVATNAPIVEALHADITSGSYALTFITSAKPIRGDR